MQRKYTRAQVEGLLERGLLHELFEVDCKGQLIAKQAAGNRRQGDLVGTVQSEGYRQATILGYKFYVHRLCYAYHHGSFPDQLIDHNNCSRDDNRFANLVPASPRYNSKKRYLKHMLWDGKKRKFKVWRAENERACRWLENCDEAMAQHRVYNGI